jgi:hypothetical protein
MLISIWSAKGGAGATVVAAALAVCLARREPGGVLLIDLGGDLPTVLGCPEPDGPALVDWLAREGDVPTDALGRLEHPVTSGLGLIRRGNGPLGHARAALLARLLAAEPRTVIADCGRIDPSQHVDARGAGAVGGQGAPGAPAGLGAPGVPGDAHGFGAPGGLDPPSALDALDALDGAVAPARLLAAAASSSLLVTRPCFLALRRAAALDLRPTGVVLVVEDGRAITAADIESVVGAPVVARVRLSPAVARAVDAGLLASALPRNLEREVARAA